MTMRNRTTGAAKPRRPVRIPDAHDDFILLKTEADLLGDSAEVAGELKRLISNALNQPNSVAQQAFLRSQGKRYRQVLEWVDSWMEAQRLRGRR